MVKESNIRWVKEINFKYLDHSRYQKSRVAEIQLHDKIV